VLPFARGAQVAFLDGVVALRDSKDAGDPDACEVNVKGEVYARFATLPAIRLSSEPQPSEQGPEQPEEQLTEAQFICVA
jgi:hypothetical protein